MHTFRARFIVRRLSYVSAVERLFSRSQILDTVVALNTIGMIKALRKCPMHEKPDEAMAEIELFIDANDHVTIMPTAASLFSSSLPKQLPIDWIARHNLSKPLLRDHISPTCIDLKSYNR